MDNVSHMWKKDKIKNRVRHRVEKLSAILPEVQTGSTNQY